MLNSTVSSIPLHAVAEPTSFVISNPGRVTFNQQQYIRVDNSQRYVPVRKVGSRLYPVPVWMWLGCSICPHARGV